MVNFLFLSNTAIDVHSYYIIEFHILIAEINFGKPFNKNILLLNFPENKSMHLSLIRVPSVHITTSVFC